MSSSNTDHFPPIPDHLLNPPISDLFISIFQPSTDAAIRIVSEMEQSWETETRELRDKCELLEASNRDVLSENQRLAQQNADLQFASLSMIRENDNLNSKLQETQTRCDEAEERNLLLTGERSTLKGQLEAAQRELERVKNTEEERASELARTNEYLKDQLLKKDQETAALLRDKERLEADLNNLVSVTGNGKDLNVDGVIGTDMWLVKEAVPIETLQQQETDQKPAVATTVPLPEHKGSLLQSDVIEISDTEEDEYDDKKNILSLKRPLSQVLRGGLTTRDGGFTPINKRRNADWKGAPYLQACETLQEVKLEDEDELSYRPGVRDVLASCRKSLVLKQWSADTDLICAFESDHELCLKAVCALYRKHTLYGKTEVKAGFKEGYASRGSVLAEYLIDKDPLKRLTKSVSDFKSYHPNGVEECRMIAIDHYKELFQIYKSKEDPWFVN